MSVPSDGSGSCCGSLFGGPLGGGIAFAVMELPAGPLDWGLGCWLGAASTCICTGICCCAWGPTSVEWSLLLCFGVASTSICTLGPPFVEWSSLLLCFGAASTCICTGICCCALGPPFVEWSWLLLCWLGAASTSICTGICCSACWGLASWSFLLSCAMLLSRISKSTVPGRKSAFCMSLSCSFSSRSTRSLVIFCSPGLGGAGMGSGALADGAGSAGTMAAGVAWAGGVGCAGMAASVLWAGGVGFAGMAASVL